MKIIILLVLFLFSIILFAGEYSITDIKKGKLSVNKYFDKTGINDIKDETNCTGLKCSISLKDNSGKLNVTLEERKNSSLTLISKGRYKDKTYAFYKYYYEIVKKKEKEKETDKEEEITEKITQYFMYSIINEEINKIDFKNEYKGYLISKDGEDIYMDYKGIHIGNKTVENSKGFLYYKAQNNPNGDLGFIGIDSSDYIHLCNNLKCSKTNFYLAKHGDRLGILSVYPENENFIHGAFYNYVNSFNKGINYINFDFASNETNDIYVFNSNERNIGWDPEIYIEENNINISGYCSSNSENYNFVFPKEKIKENLNSYPDNIEGFENEPFFTFLGGGGVMKQFWLMESSAGNAYTDYIINETYSLTGFIQGRMGDTQIALSYLQNKIESEKGIAGDVSRFFSLFFDFNDLISPQTTLRLLAEKSKVGGVSKSEYEDSEGIVYDDFVTDYLKIGLYFMFERGLYWGLDYVNYTAPGVIGLTDNAGNVVYSDYDKNLKMNQFSLILGYDISSYANRYENDFNKLYFAGNLGFGLIFYGLSDSLTSRLEAAAGEKTIVSKYGFSFLGELEAGYIFQRKFSSLKGLGYSIIVGYKAKFNYIIPGQVASELFADDEDKESVELDESELALEHYRHQIIHGPFFLINILF